MNKCHGNLGMIAVIVRLCACANTSQCQHSLVFEIMKRPFRSSVFLPLPKEQFLTISATILSAVVMNV